MVLFVRNSNSEQLTEIAEEILIDGESGTVAECNLNGSEQQVVDVVRADGEADDDNEDDEEIDKMQRFDELIGAAFNDLNGTNSVSFSSEMTDHNIPELSNENGTGGSETQALREKLARLEIEQADRVQQLMHDVHAKSEQLELLRAENELLRAERANTNELFERIERLESEKTALIDGYESKRVNYESELTGWQRKWTEEKNAREFEVERCDRLANELEKVRSDLERYRTERKSIGTSTTNLEKSILREIQTNETTAKRVVAATAVTNRATSTLPWPQLLEEITVVVGDQCESVLDANYAQLLDAMNKEIRRLQQRLADIEAKYSQTSIKYWSYLTKIETLFS